MGIEKILMLCFDKLKLLTSTKNMKEFDKSKFQSVVLNEKIQYYRHIQKMPYYLEIRIDFEKDELVIEFTSKILETKFMELINKETIYECLCAIPFVEFEDDVEFLLGDFEVLKCDVTKDVSYGYAIKRLERYVKSNLKNYDKWKCESHRNGFVLKNVAATPKYKKRIVIYHKGRELKLEKNRAFVDTFDNLDDGSFFDEYFRDKVRFEMNINTKMQIRELLGIQDNNLLSVLNSDANPLFAVLNEAVTEQGVNPHPVNSIKDYHCALVLKDCNNDLGQVEAKIRSLTSKNTSITRMMKPYRDYHSRILRDDSDRAFDLRKLLE